MSNPIRVADYIAQTIEQYGTGSIFMLTGGMMMHLMDAFGRIPSIKYVCNHHEQASAMAADGYARETGKLAVCLATSGPGATNLVTGLVGAYQDSIPILFLTGQCKRRETIRGRGIKGLRQCGFLEADIVSIVESVTKYSAFVDDPSTIRMHLEKAIHHATTGRPGPVLLDIPLDIQGASVDPTALECFVPEPQSAPLPESDIDRVLAALSNAQRPLILAGHGIRTAGLAGLFEEFISKLQIPVATTLMAKDLLPYEHPFFVGHPGPRANRGANFAVQSADVILAMGSSLHIQTVGYEGDLFAPSALKIQIDIDAALLEKETVGVDWKFNWDLRSYLPIFLEKTNKPWADTPERSDWLEICRGFHASYSSRSEAHHFGNGDDRLNLYEVVDVLSDVLGDKATILTDAGQPHPILAQAFRLKRGQRYINPGSFAEMGYALPASIGIAAAAPDKNVVAIIGDGSLQTNIQELQTLRHHDFNIKIFVINNDGYASIRNTQKTFFNGFFVGSTPSSGVSLPETEKICNAYGLRYIKCSCRAELSDAISATLEQNGAVICEIMAQYDQKILPVVPSVLLPDGSMRSKSLEEMVPEIEVSFAEMQKREFRKDS